MFLHRFLLVGAKYLTPLENAEGILSNFTTDYDIKSAHGISHAHSTATGEPGTFFLHDLTHLIMRRQGPIRKQLYLSTLFQCSVCGTNALRRVTIQEV